MSSIRWCRVGRHSVSQHLADLTHLLCQDMLWHQQLFYCQLGRFEPLPVQVDSWCELLLIRPHSNPLEQLRVRLDDQQILVFV